VFFATVRDELASFNSPSSLTLETSSALLSFPSTGQSPALAFSFSAQAAIFALTALSSFVFPSTVA